MNPPAILFVCLGNICRSPLAEAAFRAAAAEAQFECIVDSAGTGNWHRGSPPDRRAQSVAHAHGMTIGHYQARQVCADDFGAFNHIVAMDSNNLANLRSLAPHDSRASLSLLLDHVAGRESQSVADPYEGDMEDFHRCWETVTLGASALLQSLRQQHRV